MIVVFGGTAEIYDPDLVTGWDISCQVRFSRMRLLNEFLRFKQDVFRFEICMSIPDSMQKPYRTQNLLEKRLYHGGRKTYIVIHFDYIVNRFTQRLENQAKVVMMVKRLYISHNAILVFGVTVVDMFDYPSLDLCRVNVPIHGFDDLS